VLYFLLYVYNFGRDGANVNLEEVPIYVIFFTLIIGAALRKIEMMHRQDLNRQGIE